MLDLSDAHVAKILVDLGLRAPRLAFPCQFLEYADAALMRLGWRIGGPNLELLELRQYWLRYHREGYDNEGLFSPYPSSVQDYNKDKILA
jgi:hypothetical protein